jgi:hypothetical protein
MNDLIGKTISPCRIISQVRVGGMATLYKRVSSNSQGD